MKNRGRRGQVIKPIQKKYIQVKVGDYVIVKGDILCKKQERMALVKEVYKCIGSKENKDEIFYKVADFAGWEMIKESDIKGVFVPIR